MKALVPVAIGLAGCFMACPARGADILPPQAAKNLEEPIRDRSGAILLHPHITDFDGGEFTVEHDGGIARISYADMPLAYRRYFMPDPERAKEEADRRKKLVEDAQRQAILEVQRGILERQMRASADAKRAQQHPAALRQGPTYELPTAYTSREANDPAKPMRFEITVTQGVLTELFPLGGPVMSIELVGVDDDAIAVRRSRRERPQTVAVRHGRESDGQNLTWLYSDKAGASIYWADTLRRPADGGILVIEYAPQAPMRPGSPVRDQIPQVPKQQ
jgi:hypothetical protein